MATNYTVETVNTQFINQAFVDKVYSGHIKEAMDAMSTFVRQKLREEGFTRKVFTPQLVTSSDIDRDLTDQPRIIVEKEPDSVAASFGLNGKAELRYFKTPRYEVSFYKVASPDFRKSKYELATYKANIQQILQENSVKDIQKQEDKNFVGNLKTITAGAGAGPYDPFALFNAVAGTGGASSTNMAMGVTSLMEQIAVLANNQQKPGKILMPYGLYLKLLARKATMVGSAVAGESFRGAGLNDFYGFQIITTNKSDILTSDANDAAKYGDTVYVFAPESYLGQFYSLQEPTVFLKTEADMIEFHTYEAVGVGIGNVRGFVEGKYDISSAAVDPDREYIVGP